MINNLEQIIALMKFDSEDDFYHLQIIKRKKEHAELGSNSMIVKTYYIRSIEYLQKKFPEMVNLAEFHNARVCINLNRRSFEKVGFQALRKIADQIMNKDFKSIRKVYESVCGAHSNEPDKKWIVDVDEKNPEILHAIRRDIKNFEPNRRQEKVLEILETKNGYHLITSPFNMQEFKTFYPAIDVHKDNPTILYIP